MLVLMEAQHRLVHHHESPAAIYSIIHRAASDICIDPAEAIDAYDTARSRFIGTAEYVVQKALQRAIGSLHTEWAIQEGHHPSYTKSLDPLLKPDVTDIPDEEREITITLPRWQADLLCRIAIVHQSTIAGAIKFALRTAAYTMDIPMGDEVDGD